jgi:SpoVK/Ycf46/Vps4 family AAA+-type ATPase
LTIGYSGSDLSNLSSEAAMVPLRNLDDIVNIDISSIRPLGIEDFEKGLENVKASVNKHDLSKFMDWNDKYGSFPVTEEDLKD